jgi:hypothetical protein
MLFRVLLIIAAAAPTSACDDTQTGPSGATRVNAVVRDSLGSSPAVTGTLAGNFQAAVETGGRWTDLGSSNGITVTLQSASASTTVHGDQSITPGSYGRVRLLLQGVTARIARGSVVGGTTLSDDATISLGGSDARAELIVDVATFQVEADASIRRVVEFDVRSPVWLTSSALQAGRVEDAALQAAVMASTRTEAR